jgi:pimeloyl-ACP methyl ester carboxylesterase
MRTPPFASLTLVALAARLAGGEAQVAQLQAVHRNGQTFLTWQEVQPPTTAESVSFPKFKELQAAVGAVIYRIYRSDKPITSLDGLSPVGETGQLSVWSAHFNGYGDPKDTDLVPRFVIEEGKAPLAAGTGLYVHNPRTPAVAKACAEGKPVPANGAKLKGFYAVTAVVGGVENKTLTEANRLKAAVDEVEGQGVPVLQRRETPKEFNYVEGPTLEYYIRWEAPPHANRENQPFDVLVGIPKGMKEPAPIGLHLHCWGGNINGGYGWWYNAEKGSLFLAANQVPYDWWTGYHEEWRKQPASKEAWGKGVVRPYTQRRVLGLLDWAASKWKTDPARTHVGGNSMGGSGTPMLAIRHPERFAWAVAWVGVHIPEKSPTFANSYAEVYGPKDWGVKFEDGTPVWDYFNDAWYLRQYPERETPFITFSNGKNDGAIGWPQAQEFFRAMQDTKRPHIFNWGQEGHRQRAIMLITLEQRVNPMDLRLDQSLPAFTKCSLDGNPGNGDPADGDAEGGANLYLTWDTTDVVDTPKSWEMTLKLTDKAPKDTCSVDVTPRRLQQFKVKAGTTVAWTSSSGGKQVQSGKATADKHGLITIEGLTVAKAGCRLQLSMSK